MIVVVSQDGVDLEQPDDCTAFHLVGREVGPDEVSGAVSGIGYFEGEHAWIEPEVVRTDTEGRIRAHVEWETDAE